MNTFQLYLAGYLGLLAAGYAILRLSFRRDYAERGRLSPISSLAGSLYFFLLGGFPYLYVPADWPEVHLPTPLVYAGWALLWMGLATLMACAAYLGLRTSIGLGSNSLNQSGFYRYSRNPQVVGCALYGIGFAILWPSWYALGWLMLIAAMLHTMVLTEEEHLLEQFGGEYEAYCKRVPRYLGLQKKQTR